MPGYPIFLFLSDKIFSNYLILDILVSSLSVITISMLYYEIFEDLNGAKICAFLFAVYPFNIYYSTAMLSENSYVFFNILGFLFLYQNKYILAFISIVCSILIRPTLDILTILIILSFSYFVFKDSFRDSAKKILFFILIYSFMFSPWWIYNYKRFDQFVRLNLGFGTVLYSGNNELNKTGGGNLHEDFNFDLVKNVAPMEADKILKDEAIKFIINNPLRFIDLSVKKFFRFFNIHPNYKSTNIIGVNPEQEEKNKILSLLIFISGLSMVSLYGFSLLSLFFLKKDKMKKIVPLLIYFFLLTGIHMVTIASIRYRFPLTFILIILSSFSISNVINKFKNERKKYF